jgi:ABC-type branched-subunit amino acid transport system ATPase component
MTNPTTAPVAACTPFSTGRCLLDQRPVTHLTAGSRARRGVGRTFPCTVVIEHLTAADNGSLAVRLPAQRSTRKARVAKDRTRVVATFSQVGRIAGTGTAVLLAEQNQRLAHLVADRITVLEHGRTAFTATASELGQAGHDRIAELLGIAATGHAA